MKWLGDFFAPRVTRWLHDRAMYIGTLWGTIGSVSFAYVKKFKPEDQIEILKKLHEFADPMLVLAIGGGMLLILGAWSVLGGSKTQTWRLALSDEFSGTATHFVMISLVLIGWDGLTGNFDINNAYTATVAIAFAILACVPGEKPVGEPTLNDDSGKGGVPVVDPVAADLAVAFTSPAENAHVGEFERVSGTAQAPVPIGMELWLIRRWGGHEQEWYPLQRIQLNRAVVGTGFEWAVPRAFIGGRPAMSDGRRLEVWTVGPTALALITHHEAWKQVKAEGKNDVAIASLPDDMHFQAKRSVTRR